MPAEPATSSLANFRRRLATGGGRFGGFTHYQGRGTVQLFQPSHYPGPWLSTIPDYSDGCEDTFILASGRRGASG
jgi:hypothetical protein